MTLFSSSPQNMSKDLLFKCPNLMTRIECTCPLSKGKKNLVFLLVLANTDYPCQANVLAKTRHMLDNLCTMLSVNLKSCLLLPQMFKLEQATAVELYQSIAASCDLNLEGLGPQQNYHVSQLQLGLTS